MKKLTRKRKIIYWILGILVVGLIVLRIALPSILLRYVNRQLTKIDGYTGHVNDIDVSLIRGAYTIKGIKLDKTGGGIPVPFFSADAIDLSVQWHALFNGKIVAEIEVEHAILNFVKGPTEASSQTGIDNDWTDVVDKLIPIKLNRFEIKNSEIHYRDYHSSPKVDVLATDVAIVAENLSNAKRAKDTLPSTVKATATVYDGAVNLDMKIDPLSSYPLFDANARMTTMSIVKINNFLKAYGNFDAEKGTISLYMEAAAKDKRVTGYVKPLIKDLKVSNWKEDKGNLAKIAWESVVEAVSWILTNHKKDQLATRAEFTGNIDNPDVSVWVIIGQILRNAFIQALYPELENNVSITSVDADNNKKTFLQSIFGKKDKKKDAPKKIKLK